LFRKWFQEFFIFLSALSFTLIYKSYLVCPIVTKNFHGTNSIGKLQRSTFNLRMAHKDLTNTVHKCWLWLILPKYHVTVFFTELLFTEIPFDRTPFDQKLIFPKKIIWPKYIFTESSFHRNIWKRVILPKLKIEKWGIWPKLHLTENS
jgi:hypothetical protein